MDQLLTTLSSRNTHTLSIYIIFIAVTYMFIYVKIDFVSTCFKQFVVQIYYLCQASANYSDTFKTV